MQKSATYVFLLFLLGSSLAQARIVSYEVISREHKVFTLKEACELSGHKHNLLIRADSTAQIDCMASKVKVKDFCHNQSLKAPFLRAYVPFKSKDSKQRELDDKVFCVKGKAARLSFSCETSGKRHYCEDPQKSCLKLKNDFAHDLELTYSARQFDEADEILHCHYTQKLIDSQEDLPDTPSILPMIPKS